MSQTPKPSQEPQASQTFQTSQKKTGYDAANSKHRDSSSKIIFEDPTLCAQFLKGYLDIPLLKDVQPEDIEDVTNRYVHLFTEERSSDVVKKVHIRTNGHEQTKKSQEMPFYLISLIEHKSNVDYNVVMQVFRYIVFIWEDYEKEMEKQQPGVSKTKGFRYPPILPIVFYDGPEKWTSSVQLHDRILLSDVLGEYIPDYRCILMQLREYSNAELMKREDVLSVVMMMTNLHKVSDFVKIENEVSQEYLQRVLKDTPAYLLEIVTQVTEALLNEINVPDEEINRFSAQIKERHMGRLFANFEPYDVQATRREAREEALLETVKLLKEFNIPDEEINRFSAQIKERNMGRSFANFEPYDVQATRREAREEGRKLGLIEGLINGIKQLGGTMETAAAQLVELYALDEAEAQEKVKQYW